VIVASGLGGQRRARRLFFALFVTGAVAAVTAAAAVAAGPRFAPGLHHDATELRKDPLDLRAAAFGQVGTQLALTLRTWRAWPAHGASADSLCVTLLADRPVGQMCVAANGARKPIVRFRRARSGGTGYWRLRTVRAAEVERSGRTLRALVYPRAIGLRPGALRWFVRSRWRKGVDRLPNSGAVPLQVSVYGAPRCFGAAARAGASGCENPALRRLVTPAPSDAELMPDLPCHPRHLRRYAPVVPCSFAAAFASGPPRLALIGDSHAMSFRATVKVASDALGLKAVSLATSGCGFGLEVASGRRPVSEHCRRHTEQVLHWLSDHPSIDIAVLTSSAIQGYTEDGLARLWSRIPDSVKSVYVVVDVPRVSFKTAGCVQGVRNRHAVSAGACALPRDDQTLPPDPTAGAVAQSGPRVHLIDLTKYFCDSEHCFPVIGGAYVYRDTNHMNTVFAATLGPYLLEGMGLTP
jgi:SGNH domain (fused to AT3 domains)